MSRFSVVVVLALSSSLLSVAACEDEALDPVAPTGAQGGAGAGGGNGGSGGVGGPMPQPPASFDRYCSAPWDEGLETGKVGELSGTYVGVIAADPPFAAGTLETMKIIPQYPFWAKTLRVAFGRGPGTARIRLMTTFGRSYPGGWPDVEDAAANLITPVDIDVGTDPDPESWIEIDIAAQGVFLEPTQHYVLVYEHLGTEPLMAVEEVPMGTPARSLIHVPGEDVPFGLDGHYRMELAGDTFCRWSEAERWFGEDASTPFAMDASARVAVVDLDGDGHDDVVVNAGGPKAYFGDGTGAFAAPTFDPFADVPNANMLIFGDLDNDGDRDAFASHYIQIDSDGDNQLAPGGDCNDADAAVRPNATEVTNGYDDDCDGVADAGTDTSDADMDGHSIFAGDCDDTRAEVYPGAPELLDRRDNDCDLEVDEIFGNRILLNDGSGALTVVSNAGVDTFDPTAAGALGDGNADGFLDVYWGNWLEHYPDPQAVPDHYATGNGDGSFTDMTQAAGLGSLTPRPCYGVQWHDFDNDGDQDLYVGNYQLVDNRMFLNDNGSFTDVAAAKNVHHDAELSPFPQYPGGHSYGAAFGDLDNDGDLDFFQTNLAHPRTMPWSDQSMLYFNDGAPSFSFVNRRVEMGIVYDEGDVNAALADFDNDMDLDLVVASLYPNHYSKLYRNDGDVFTDVTYETNTAVHDAVTAVWSDVDEDGDLDLIIADRSAAPNVHLFQNRVGGDNNWIVFDLQGSTSNRDAIGARVVVEAGGVTQMREVAGGGGHSNAQSTRLVHFGLGQNAAIDSVTVRWVGGATETISGAAINGRFHVVEGSGNAVP
jgi:hypothetical protein